MRVRRIMQCAWPCITSKGSTGFDPTVKYHAHLMLAHVMATFAINKRLVSLVRPQIYLILYRLYSTRTRICKSSVSVICMYTRPVH